IAKADGSVVIVAGSGSAGYQDGNTLNAWFNSVRGLASDGTNVWVSDYTSYRIRQIVAGSGLPSGQSGLAGTTVNVSPGLVESPWIWWRL
ncbi:MAG TPA: hypothetical protein VGR90_01975, partial [Acidimicrobiales bacterium]|nr:hypothetical protein [Acidimicrobiales bacterium]